MAGVQGRVAFITGAAQGIGAACAQRLASDGAAVAVADINAEAAETTAAAIRDAGGRAIGVACDVTQRDSVQSAVDAVATEFGSVHILVSNAGVLRDNLLFKMSDSDWTTVMDVHLRGAFLTTQIAQKYMVEAKFGRIVYMSSTSSLGNRGQSNYSTAKMGLQGLAKTVALELGPFGVTANAIAPGFIKSEMTMSTAQRQGIDPDVYFADIQKALPVRRLGLPADIANTVAFFASEEAGYVTGQTLIVDGGRRLS